jgi:methylglutaconyl-CoA hydratase
VKIGFIPALVSVFLIRKVGEHKAKQLLLTGEVFKAQEAKSHGLINNVVQAEDLEQTVFDFASGLINSNSGQSMQLIKQLISRVQSLSLGEALEYAATTNAQARATDECKAGIAAFLNKQELKW